jgi:hypothetical protein
VLLTIKGAAVSLGPPVGGILLAHAMMSSKNVNAIIRFCAFFMQ